MVAIMCLSDVLLFALEAETLFDSLFVTDVTECVHLERERSISSERSVVFASTHEQIVCSVVSLSHGIDICFGGAFVVLIIVPL